MEALNRKYSEKRRDPSDLDYGLLDGERQYLDYKIYAKTGAGEQSLVLVHFSDRILNFKAEELKLRVHLQDMYQTLPFVLEA